MIDVVLLQICVFRLPHCKTNPLRRDTSRSLVRRQVLRSVSPGYLEIRRAGFSDHI